MHPLDEFEYVLYPHSQWLMAGSGGLIAVEAVDSSLRDVFGDGDWQESFLSDEAFSGNYAVMYNRRLVTGFIFDDAPFWWHRYRFISDPITGQTEVLDLEYIAMSMNGKWGLIGQSGDVVLDFMFDGFLMIDENTAFASYNGNYGILDIRRTIEQIHQ